MKKITLLSLFLLCIFIGNAQLFNIGGFGVGYLYVGPKIGGNASFNSRDAITGYKAEANYGYQFGGVAKVGITKKLAIEPEIIFSKRGARTVSGDITFDQNAKYFGIPVIAKYAFAAISGIQIYGAGGFYTDYMTGVDMVFKQGGTVRYEEQINSDTLSTIFRRVDFGLNVGGGAVIPFKNKDQLTIDFRVVVGLVDTDKLGSTSSKNTSIQVSAIYLVDLTKWISFKGRSIMEDDAYVPSMGAPYVAKVFQ